MIKINLLPFRAARKKENIRREVSIFLLTMLFLFVVSGYLHISLTHKLDNLQKRETQLRDESKKYDKIMREMAILKKEIKLVETRLGVIEGLESHRTEALQLLEEVAFAAPVEKLWLRSLSESKGLLTLQGTAMDHNTVARFMTSLGKAEHITTVDLKSTQLQHFPDYKLKASNFVLTGKVSFSKPEPKPEKKDGKKGK